ncbi:hypothetical protein HNQ02_000471 [Flavobacterium sp. 7E]|uniref:hypothetical protein n=1 Tax=Flavobacterium sp. 7E TaxID=2735898 RepID=UPI00156F0B0E|nr:hypothetical protein [Flavobacterium sp. 7E]NRS87564.1 hypothetical protein [Flavobacterium sp. 7E]
MKYIIILFSLLNITVLNAQKQMNYTKEELNTKSKEELIEIAKHLLEKKYPEIVLNLNDFNSRVWSNEYGIINVFFNRVIRYAPNTTDNICYDITVNLDTKEIMPFDKKDLVFYTSSEKANSTIKYLKKKGLLPKNNKLDIEYTINENSDYYLISCFDNLHHIDKNVIGNKNHPYLSKTLINKKTDEILFFKGQNPYYYLSLKTFKEYYQENLYTVLKNKNTSNNKIIEIANSILKEKKPHLQLNLNDFEIVILGNYKDIFVKYRRFIRIKNNNQNTVFDLVVNIITKEVLPFNSSEVSFYPPSLSDKKIIQTIQNNITFELISDIEYTISENQDYFFITSVSENSVKKYFILKKTNQVIWNHESGGLRINNREDLSLVEHYKRMNGFFSVDSEHDKPLIDIALAILKEKQFIPTINLDEYSTKCKASKNEIKIQFTRLVKFIPLKHKGNLNYDLNVNLVEQTVTEKPTQFYFPTKEDSITTDLITNKLIDYIKDFDKTHYPIEIIEKEDYFTIRTSNYYNLRTSAQKHYQMDKKTKTIEVIFSPNSFFPSPAAPPPSSKEIKD